MLDAGTVYYTAVQSIIPVAATSEISFRAYYDKLVRRDGDPPAQTFLLGYDSEPIRAEKSLYDLAAWAREVPGSPRRSSTHHAGPGRVAAHRGPAGRHGPGTLAAMASPLPGPPRPVRPCSLQLDFVSPVPADDPSPLLETVKFYLRGQGTDPHERQRLLAARREEETSRTPPGSARGRRAAFLRLLRWAQNAAPIREDALADVGLAWPLLRRMLLELGRRLVGSGVIAEPADVFWLRHRELRSAVEFGLAGAGRPGGRGHYRGRAARPGRRRRGAQDALAGPGKGRRPAAAAREPVDGAGLRVHDAGRLTGPAGRHHQRHRRQPGRVSAPARVLRGPEDFAQMVPGDVLVARITTPAWTSLFAMASAVVTDVGGPLSHSSIVAREYGIPAVLGTGVATQRLTSGQRIRVDGDAGTVTIEQ